MKRALVVLPLGLTGCLGLFAMKPAETAGPNPLGGAPLTVERAAGSTPGYDCGPRPRERFELAATADEVCVTVHGVAIEQDVSVASPPLKVESIEVALALDTRRTERFEIRPDAPQHVAACRDKTGQGGYDAYTGIGRLWTYTSRGCLPNGGRLGPTTKAAELFFLNHGYDDRAAVKWNFR